MPFSGQPQEAEAIRQRLQQAVVVAKREAGVLFARLARYLNREPGDIEVLIGDDTGIARHGNHCVGTARQYSGTLGRVDRCQVIPSLHAAGPSGSFCLGARLYLPESRTNDPQRRKKAGVPDGVTFATKWELMLGLLDQATQSTPDTASLGWEELPFIGDAGYGDVRSPSLRCAKRGLRCRRSPGKTDPARSDEATSERCACSRPAGTVRAWLPSRSSG